MEFGLVLRLIFALFVLNALLFFVTILHEYGHMLMLRRMGKKVDHVSIGVPVVFKCKIDGVEHRFGLFALWGIVKSSALETSPVRDRALVALAGPGMSLVVGILLLVFCDGIMGGMGFLPHMFGVMNVGMAVINMLPLPPFDGFPALEWFLKSRYNIDITVRTRKVLLGVGIAAMTGLCLLPVPKF